MTRAGGHFEGASREIRKCTYSLSERQKRACAHAKLIIMRLTAFCLVFKRSSLRMMGTGINAKVRRA